MAGTGDATPALRETADKLGTIRSGIITFSMEFDPRGDAEPFGFSFTGPFELAESGDLPRVDVEYTQKANGQKETVRLVSDGAHAVAVVGGQQFTLDGAALEDLRSAGADVLGSSGNEEAGLATLRVDRWLVDPELSGGPDGTDKIEGELDPVEVANGLIELAGSLTGTERLDAESSQQLRDAVETSDFELLTGRTTVCCASSPSAPRSRPRCRRACARRWATSSVGTFPSSSRSRSRTSRSTSPCRRKRRRNEAPVTTDRCRSAPTTPSADPRRCR